MWLAAAIAAGVFDARVRNQIRGRRMDTEDGLARMTSLTSATPVTVIDVKMSAGGRVKDVISAKLACRVRNSLPKYVIDNLPGVVKVQMQRTAEASRSVECREIRCVS